MSSSKIGMTALFVYFLSIQLKNVILVYLFLILLILYGMVTYVH